MATIIGGSNNNPLDVLNSHLSTLTRHVERIAASTTDHHYMLNSHPENSSDSDQLSWSICCFGCSMTAGRAVYPCTVGAGDEALPPPGITLDKNQSTGN